MALAPRNDDRGGSVRNVFGWCSCCEAPGHASGPPDLVNALRGGSTDPASLARPSRSPASSCPRACRCGSGGRTLRMRKASSDRRPPVCANAGRRTYEPTQPAAASRSPRAGNQPSENSIVPSGARRMQDPTICHPGKPGMPFRALSHRDTGHDDLLVREAGHLAHDVGPHDPLPVDERAEAAIPGRERIHGPNGCRRGARNLC